MSNDNTPAADRGSECNAELGPEPERAAFSRWCRENGHGELDDMLTPLDRSLRALMWPVWQGAVASERERLLALATKRADYEVNAAAHYAVQWPVAHEHHLKRHAAIRDLIADLKA